MRYISKYDAKLYTNDGEVKYRFKDGVLDLGTNVIDTTLDTTDPGPALQRPYEFDLAGTQTVAIELCGQGDLISYAGEERIFYEAPILDTTDDLTIGQYYQLQDGAFEYGGHKYYPGETFQVLTTDIFTVLASSTYSLTFPPGPEVIDMKGQFHDKHLLWGDEPKDYWVLNEAGYEPRNDLATADLPEGYNYTR